MPHYYTSSLTTTKGVQECVKAVDFALKHFQKGLAFTACIPSVWPRAVSTENTEKHCMN